MSCLPTYKGKRYNSIDEIDSALEQERSSILKEFNKYEGTVDNFIKFKTQGYEKETKPQQESIQKEDVKQEKVLGDAKETPPLREQSPEAGKKQEVGMEDMQRQPKKEKIKPKKIEEASSIDELQEISQRKGISPMDKTYQVKMEQLRSADREKFKSKVETEQKSKPKKEGFSLSGKKKPGALTKEWFSKDLGAPKGTTRRYQKLQGGIASEVYKAQKTNSDFKNAVKLEYGKDISDKDIQKIDYALKTIGATEYTRQEALKDVPKSLHQPMIEMRNHIDYLSRELNKIPWVNEKLDATIDANEGFYLTRSYKSQTDPKNYNWDTIPTDLKVRAYDAMKRNFPEMTNNEIEGNLKNLLDGKTGKSIFSSPLSIETGITKGRSLFLTNNPEIRELMGEYKDPSINYLTSVAKMSDLVEKSKFVQDLTEKGLNEGWLKQDMEGDHRVKIDVDVPMWFTQSTEGEVSLKEKKGAKKLQPLTEYYTTPEYKEAIESYAKSQRTLGPLAKAWMAGVTLTKLNKTAGSIKSIERNFLSNPINVVSNANWNVKGMVDEFNRFENRRKYIEELKRQGILDDNYVVGELKKNMNQLELSNSNQNMLLSAISGSKSVPRAALKAYSWGDDFWKANRYLSEKAKYRKVFENKGYSPEEAGEIAAGKASEIVHDTSTYYSELPKIMQELRWAPFTGSFLSFPYLTTLNYIRTVQLGINEIRDADTRHLGIQRLAGAAGAVASIGAFAMYKNAQNGVDDEEQDDLRMFLPSYWQNDIITFKKEKDGIYSYTDLSFMDYYGAITKPISVLMRASRTGELKEEDILNAAKEFLEPLIQPDIFAAIWGDIYANKSSQTGRPIYNKADTVDSKYESIVGYALKQMEPSTLTDFRRIRDIKKQGGNWAPYATSLLWGGQKRQLDISKSFRYYTMNGGRKDLNDAVSIYRDELRNKKATDKSKKDAYERASKRFDYYLNQMRDSYNAAQRLGVDKMKLNNIIKETYGLDKDIRNYIIYGIDVGINKDGKVVPYGNFK